MRHFAVVTALSSAAVVSAGTPPVIDRNAREVHISAVVQPRAMERPFGVKGHHAIVWNGGKSKRWALFVSEVSDRDVRAALDSLGAHRGENLTPDTWNARHDEKSREPDKRVDGSRVDVFVAWSGSGGRIPLSRLISEKGHDTPALDLRYGGNQEWQTEFQSGCIVCLYSCPGGAIGNYAHTIRDYVRDGVVYASIPERLPPAGTKVTIIFRVFSSQ